MAVNEHEERVNVSPARSVRTRFVLISLPIITVLVLAILAAFYAVEFRRTHEELTAKLDRMIVNYGILVAQPLLSGDAEQVSVILAASTDDPDLIGIAVRDVEGRTVARIGRLDDEPRDDLMRVKPLHLATETGLRRVGELHVVLDDKRLDQTLDRLLGLSAVLMVTIVAATVIGSAVALEQVAGRRLRRLVAHIRTLRSGAPDPPPSPEPFDEVGVLVDAFNDLQRRRGEDEAQLRAASRDLERRVRERTAELEVARDAAEEASRAKSAFLANLSHELRTPMNAITGFAEILKTETHGPLGDRRYAGYVDDIAVSAEHLTTLINNLLDLSKAEAGKLQPDLRPVDIGRMTDNPMRLLRVQAQNAGVEIRRDVGDGLPEAMADPQMTGQILLNLLSNAVKFTPAGGQVTVSARPAGSGCIELAVSDTGIGIAEADIPRILQPFEQVESGLQRRYAGTGLGLPLARTLAELQGGELTIESAEGRGTTVRVTLRTAGSVGERQA